jgi:hypothetical protein
MVSSCRSKEDKCTVDHIHFDKFHSERINLIPIMAQRLSPSHIIPQLTQRNDAYSEINDVGRYQRHTVLCDIMIREELIRERFLKGVEICNINDCNV